MQRKALLLGVLFTAEILVMLDGMVVSVALPAIGEDVGLTRGELQWVVTAYTVPLGSFLLVGGRAADRWGRRRLLVGGLVAFGLGSLVAGLARGAELLLAGRALAGLGAAFAIPAALALITAVTAAGRERNRALGFMSASIDIGMVLGAVVGGLVAFALGWPWIFLLMVPLAVVAAGLAALVLPESRADGAPEPLDWPGATAAALGLALVILALVALQRDGLSGSAAPAFAGATVLLGLFAVRQRAARVPLLPPRLLRSRQVNGANLTIVANAGAFGGTVVLSTLLMQRELGLSELETGLGFVPLALSALAGGFIAAPLIDRLGTALTVAASLVVTAAALGWIAAAGESGYLAALLPAYVVCGATFATAAVPLTARAVEGARRGERALAAGLFQTFTHVGGAVVLAVLVICAAAWGLRVGFAVAAGGLLGAAALALVFLRQPHLHLKRDVGARAGSG